MMPEGKKSDVIMLRNTRDMGDLVTTENLLSINHKGISEQITKAQEKMEREDFSGAITNIYTLVEELLKHLLKENSIEFNHNGGNIKKLYKALRHELNLDPSSDDIAKLFKPILDANQKSVASLYEIANKCSDRHARIYDLSEHYAQLAVNSAFTLCEFLLASHDIKKQNKNTQHRRHRQDPAATTEQARHVTVTDAAAAPYQDATADLHAPSAPTNDSCAAIDAAAVPPPATAPASDFAPFRAAIVAEATPSPLDTQGSINPCRH